MLNSKLIETIRVFDRAELEKLHAFVRSPFFHEEGNQQDMIALYEYIYHCLLSSQPGHLDKKTAFESLFPDIGYSEGKLNKLMSRLMKMVKKFINYTYSDLQNPSAQLLIMARFYRLKHQEKQFDDLIKRFQKASDKNISPTELDYLYEFLFEKEVTEFRSYRNLHKGDINLKSSMESLDKYYIVMELYYTCMFLSQKFEIDLELNQRFIDINDFAEVLSKSEHLQTPLIKSYFYAIQMLTFKERRDMQKLQDFVALLDQNRAFLPTEDLKALLALARNYCVELQNRGYTEFTEEAFKLYKDHLQRGYLYYEGKLLPGTSLTIVVLGLKLNENEWVKDFIEKHRKKIIGTDYPEEVYRFNLASYFFHIKDFNGSLEYLKSKYEDVLFNVAARRLEIKNYYEIQSPLLESKMDAFKIYTFRLSKKLLQDVHKQLNNNFIDYLRQVLSSITAKNDKRIDKLKEKLQAEKRIAEKTWLLEKLEELR